MQNILKGMKGKKAENMIPLRRRTSMRSRDLRLPFSVVSTDMPSLHDGAAMVVCELRELKTQACRTIYGHCHWRT